ncbi:hypothetical protein, partial [Thermococcus sp. GR4]|uniref:hypothetical protein n=1 Tax=Thermococcus sp. GR4 TaxID=1638254 RepID=UPI001431569F
MYSDDLNTFRADEFSVTVYYHQNQLVLVFDSDFVFNEFSALFYFLYNYFVLGKVTGKSENVNFGDWEYAGEMKVKKNKESVFVFVNRKYSIMMFRYSLNKDKPVIIRFLDTDFATGKRKSIENNVITISKVYTTQKTVITVNWAGKFERAFELLQILHDMILEYKKRDIDFSIAKIRPVRTELFVRYNRR